MTTTSFNKKIIVKDDNAAKALLKGFTNTKVVRQTPKINVVTQLERSSLLLKRKYSR